MKAMEFYDLFHELIKDMDEVQKEAMYAFTITRLVSNDYYTALAAANKVFVKNRYPLVIVIHQNTPDLTAPGGGEARS